MLLAVILSVAMLTTLGWLPVAEAHLGTGYYYKVVVDILDYERIEYSGFDPSVD